MTRTVVKLGSSVVTTPGALEHVCDATAAAREAGDEVVLVSSGAIAYGLEVMGLGPRPAAIEDLQAASAVGQGRLFRTWDALLAERGAQAAQLLLTFHDLGAREHYLNVRRTLERLLDWRVVPVINENDTTTTDEISFGDNDFLAAQVAVLLRADRLVLLTNTDGVYTANPSRDPAARLVPEVTDPGLLEQLSIGHETSPLGTGGMRSKVVAAEMATAAGTEAVVCSGVRPDALRRALAGSAEGTRFAPRPLGISSFKLWLKYAKPSMGTLIVDAGAARALRDAGTSLLPVGITEVRGDFDAGDAVHIAEGETVLGKGIVSYAAEELRQVVGLKSAAIREVLPRATDEAVHRDYFVLA